MHGAPALLIKERIFGELLDVVVQAKGNLAKGTGSGIGIEHGVKKIQAFGGTALNDLTVVEGQTHVLHFVAIIQGGITEANSAVDRIFDRSTEDFTIGKVFCTCTVNPFAPTHAISNICIRGDDVNFIVLVEEFDNTLLLSMNFTPPCNRIVLIEQTCGIYKIFVIAQGHARILSVGIGRKQCSAPTGLPLAQPLQRTFKEASARLAPLRYPFGINTAQAFGVL